jgi:uncharacterized protein
MTDTPTVAVRGEVTREVEPELATLTVTVSARGKDRQQVLTRLTERTEALRQLLDRYADAIEKRETSRLYVYPEVKGPRERVSSYIGTVSTTVTFADFTQLGDVVLVLADQDQTSVYGPNWSLRPDSPAYREARRAAIGDALARAREYADALGARLVRLVELTDVGMSGDQGPRPLTFAMRTAGMPQEAQLELDPQLQTVQAAIEARFVISEPTLDGPQPVSRPAGEPASPAGQ